MGLELNGNESIITYKDNTSTAVYDPVGERQILKNTHKKSDGTNNYTGVHFKGDRTNQPWKITQKINIDKTHSYTILTVTDFGDKTSLSASSTIEGVIYSVRIYKPFYNAENNVTTVTFETAGTFTSSADFEATITSYSKFVEHSIILNNNTKINGNLICDGFNIGTLSKNSSIETLNSNLIINEGTSNMDVQLPNINFSNSTTPATKIALALEKGHYSNKNYYWLTATLDYNYFYIFSVQYDGEVYSGLFYFDQDLSTSTEKTVHLMNLNNSRGDGDDSEVRLFASSWTLPDNKKWSNKVGFNPVIVNVGPIAHKASGYSLYKIPYHFDISGYSSSI